MNWLCTIGIMRTEMHDQEGRVEESYFSEVKG